MKSKVNRVCNYCGELRELKHLQELKLENKFHTYFCNDKSICGAELKKYYNVI